MIKDIGLRVCIEHFLGGGEAIGQRKVLEFALFDLVAHACDQGLMSLMCE